MSYMSSIECMLFQWRRKDRPEDRVLKLHVGFHFSTILVPWPLDVQHGKHGGEHKPYGTLHEIGTRTTATAKAEHEHARIAPPSSFIVNLLEIAFGVETFRFGKNFGVA